LKNDEPKRQRIISARSIFAVRCGFDEAFCVVAYSADGLTTLVEAAIAAGARQREACAVIGLSEHTLQRWQGDSSRGDRGPARRQEPANRKRSINPRLFRMRSHFIFMARKGD
jgi:hypothetical protein